MGLLTLCVAILVGVATVLVLALLWAQRSALQQRTRTVPLLASVTGDGRDRQACMSFPC
jgi:hypothetical protein